MRALTLLIALILSSACTDATWDRWAALGEEASIRCYSGGKLTFSAISTGKVESEQHSDGYFARWKLRETSDWARSEFQDNQIVSAGVSGDCVIVYTH